MMLGRCSNYFVNWISGDAMLLWGRLLRCLTLEGFEVCCCTNRAFHVWFFWSMLSFLRRNSIGSNDIGCCVQSVGKTAFVSFITKALPTFKSLRMVRWAAPFISLFQWSGVVRLWLVEYSLHPEISVKVERHVFLRLFWVGDMEAIFTQFLFCSQGTHAMFLFDSCDIKVGPFWIYAFHNMINKIGIKRFQQHCGHLIRDGEYLSEHWLKRMGGTGLWHSIRYIYWQDHRSGQGMGYGAHFQLSFSIRYFWLVNL